ncbi:inositol polyphosphate 5-phosphatase [Pichia californica]|uniref:phosphoinositide 5-phosphatase n=1 Tax=Pichia californica TaxID=460514 RepID=A0A9P6WHH5_9ASCO|nr:inositol polyphosphate 5-phosphatase [[Candida] californica]
MNILLRPGSKRTLALESTSHVLLFRYIHETEKCAIELIPKSSFISQPYKQLSRTKPQGFLGLIEMNNDIFLCVITQKITVAQPLPGENINKISDVEFHSLTNDSWDFLDLNSNGYPNVESDLDPQSINQPPRIPQHPCYELRKLLSDGSFFYSSDFDLTSTLQGRGVNVKQRLSVDLFHTDYMWNAFMMEGIINFRNSLSDKEKIILDKDHFLTTVIRGFAETLNTAVNGRSSKITIISKQSWKRAGTRFNVRGVDDDGNVANFVETELIYNDGNYLFAFTQIRGSIPVFWEQDTALISPKVQITRSFDATQPTFEKHFENLIGKYGPIHIVNLLSKTRSSEIELSQTYKKHFIELRKTHQDSVFFTDFDFHQETSKTYADATRLLPLLNESFDDFDFFSYDLNHSRIISEQKGTFRTNCLDCLDRTNVIQQVISLQTLIDFFDKRKIHNLSSLKEQHRVLWADHGDRISQIYTGTNALKSSFSRSGKMGFAGALSDATKSISRIYINNFVDKGKQQLTDTLLGKMSSQRQVLIYDPITEYINEKLTNYESKFTSYSGITIFTGTFNLAGASDNKNLTEWLFPEEGFSPDMFVVGFQEVVELNASNILKNDGSVGQYWTKEVETTISKNSNDTYVLLRSEFMSSILLLLFVKADHVANVTEVEGKSKKTGLGGITANKGTVAIRLNFCSTSFCFVNSHLSSGLQYTEERNNDFISCWNGIRFSRNRYIKHHDNIVWLGDLNYRITIPNEKVRELIDRDDLVTLFSRDQLSYQMMRIQEFKFFKESEITFPPTYKFDKFSDVYDTSEKQRVPAWTDRILYRGKSLKSDVYYYTKSVQFSDHRPVYNIFHSQVKLIDEECKDNICNKIRESYKLDNKIQGDHIDLNDVSPNSSSPSFNEDIRSKRSSRSSAPSSASIVNLSAPTGNLLDFDSISSITPPLPQRRPLPPVYNAEETKKMLIPGLTPVGVQNSIETSLKSAPPTPNRPATISSYSVMAPTVSRTGTPLKVSQQQSAASTPPPPPPPRRNTSEVGHSRVSSTNESSSTISKDSHKIAPLVPNKPTSLKDMFHDGSLEETSKHTTPNVPTPLVTSWTAMAPTKRM